ncbi:MAG: helix-turn-helix domain-containing protein [Candidatus Hydrogenedentes bacterium]|nr:helix-turn-helix domain-containing protein [Candidatus Hydrogenedentota bacterium]
MDAQEFFSSTDAQRTLERAATIAGTPVSLHTMDDDREGERLTGCGHAAAACTHVQRLPWGRQACLRSREKAGAAALRRAQPVPFLCHMGFSCVTVAAPSTDSEACCLTFGPFCPSEAPGSLERDALVGLQALSQSPVDELPFELTDIATVSASAIPEIAEWTAETLKKLTAPPTEAPVAATESKAPLRPPRSGAPRKGAKRPELRDPYQASAIAGALAGGNQAAARELVKGMITDTTGAKRRRLAVQRARTVAIVSTVLEAAERSGLATKICWERFPAFEQATRKAKNPVELGATAMAVLGTLKRQAVRSDDPKKFVQLDKILRERLCDGVTLAQMAELLQQRPSSITRRLQRNFGMSYSEYVGRMRVDKSKELLRRTNLKMLEVARRVGIDDAANFSKLFRKHEGMSPTEYRRRYARSR